jgi:hypothetical protein
MSKTPTDYETIDASASLIAKEKFGIKSQKNKHFVVEPKSGEVYMIGFGFGHKTPDNLKGFYAYWVWARKGEPYGAMVNCILKDKYDAIDYFQSCIQNAEQTITTVLNESTPR